MLLRRITEHVKAQNWFAVGLDFLIVVVGVFMGFQVTEWATEQNQRARETIYLERLHGEVVQLTQDRLQYTSDVRENQLALSGAIEVLQNQTDRLILTNDECEAIAESHIYHAPTADLPTIAELLSTGRLDALQAKDVRTAITRFNQSALRGGGVIDAVNRNILTLARVFPELIRLKTVPDENTAHGIRSAAQCDATAMKVNAQFMNTFIDNRDRYAHYAAYAVEPVTEKLAMLHSALDAELGIVHGDVEANP